MLVNPELLMPAIAALGIGLLIGLQREYDQRRKDTTHHSEPAGIRTFAFVSLLGNLLTWLPAQMMSWGIMIGLAATAGLAMLAYQRSSNRKRADVGMTTEIALVLIFVLGVLTGLGHVLQASILAVVVFTLLSYKKLLHRFSGALSPMDMHQALQFLIVTVVILPILPDQAYGPYGAFNPQRTWLMVVLISGIGFAAYTLIKTLGQKAGLSLTGLLGGLVSSTAVTLTMSRLCRSNPALQMQCVLAILLACATMFPRVWALTLIFNAQLSLFLLFPAIAVIAVTLVVCVLLWKKTGSPHVSKHYRPEFNPLSLPVALGFGAFFAFIVLLTRAAQDYFGDAGILGIAFLSGLSDVDAITLSVSQMDSAAIVAQLAAQAILLACAANSAVKLAIGLIIAPSDAHRWLLIGLLPMIFISLAAVIWLAQI